jgi:16S rRNA processing protein RimM
VGRVARAHGVRGRILVVPYNAASEGLERVGAIWLARLPTAKQAVRGALERRAVAHAERVHLGYLFGLEGLSDRDVADGLRGCEVSVDRSELPELAGDEVLEADLIGCGLFDKSGAERGKVVGFESAGPNELLVIALPAGGQALLPMSLVVEVDGAAARVVAEIPDGLFEAQL